MPLSFHDCYFFNFSSSVALGSRTASSRDQRRDMQRIPTTAGSSAQQQAARQEAQRRLAARQAQQAQSPRQAGGARLGAGGARSPAPAAGSGAAPANAAST